jgi:phosphate transporter
VSPLFLQDIELVEYPVPRTTGLQGNLPQKPSLRGDKTPRQTDRNHSVYSYQLPETGPFYSDKPVKLRYWVDALRRRSANLKDREATSKMKFSHSIQFNAVPDWSAYYIAYSNLKKLYVDKLGYLHIIYLSFSGSNLRPMA